MKYVWWVSPGLSGPLFIIFITYILQFSSVQFSRSVVSDSSYKSLLKENIDKIFLNLHCCHWGGCQAHTSSEWKQMLFKINVSSVFISDEGFKVGPLELNSLTMQLRKIHVPVYMYVSVWGCVFLLYVHIKSNTYMIFSSFLNYSAVHNFWLSALSSRSVEFKYFECTLHQ